jgi:Tfp pilus assembly protein FimT
VIRWSQKPAKRIGEHGFTFVETFAALGISFVLFSFSVLPLRQAIQGYRLAADARAVASQMGLARMRAAAGFTQSQLRVDLTANTFEVDVYDKTTATFQREGGVFSLSSGDTFSFGSVTVPAGQQAAIAQSTPITFNSRGVPVDGSGTPTATSALYLTDNSGTYWAVSVSAAGQIGLWQYSNGSWIAR